MKNDDKMRITQSLLSAYDTYLIDGQNKQLEPPSRQQVDTLLTKIKNLLFPGFFLTQSLEIEALTQETQKNIEFITETLTDLIEKSILWAPNVETAEKINPTKILLKILESLPILRKMAIEDAQAIFEGDPAAKSIPEIILAYPGLHAMLIYRIAHILYLENIPIIPRLMSEIAHSQTGIDIHPGATIGHSIFIDHGTGIVIGETAEIGNFVKLYQGVTLGAFSVSKDTKGRRHPKLGNHVTVYARSTILGGNTEIGDHCVIGGNVWLTQSLPPKTTIYLSSDFKQVIKEQKNQNDSN